MDSLSELPLLPPILPNGLSKLLLTGPVSEPIPLSESARADKVADERCKQAAKDFESVLIAQILEQMKDTIPDSGLLQDASSKQMEGMFWLYLARDIANKGGFGLWKNIYEALTQTSNR